EKPPLAKTLKCTTRAKPTPSPAEGAGNGRFLNRPAGDVRPPCRTTRKRHSLSFRRNRPATRLARAVGIDLISGVGADPVPNIDAILVEVNRPVLHRGADGETPRSVLALFRVPQFVMPQRGMGRISIKLQ